MISKKEENKKDKLQKYIEKRAGPSVPGDDKYVPKRYGKKGDSLSNRIKEHLDWSLKQMEMKPLTADIILRIPLTIVFLIVSLPVGIIVGIFFSIQSYMDRKEYKSR